MIVSSFGTTDETDSHYGIVEVRVEDGSQTVITSQAWHYVGQIAWLSDGGGFVFTATDAPSSPEQVWYLSRAGGEPRKITSDVNNYVWVSFTADSSTLATVQKYAVSSLWVAPAGNIGEAKQVASEAGWLEQIDWTPEGAVVYQSNASGNATLYTAEADGANAKPLGQQPGSNSGYSVSPDGRYIVFCSSRAGARNLWRLDTTSGDLFQLTSGQGEIHPECSPDGRWVVYESGFGSVRKNLWRVAIEGGEPVRLTTGLANGFSISPDGKTITHYFMGDTPDNRRWRWRIKIISFDGGRELKSFDVLPALMNRHIRWTPDGHALAYTCDTGGVSNIWIQPIDGGAPKQITDFRSERIYAFAWSRDGKQIAVARAAESSYVALITDSQ